MGHDIFLVLLWITAILLIISGLDDLYLDLLYWFLKGRHKSNFPDFSAMHYKEEKPVAIFLGAWNESSVIGRTLSFAVNNILYKNYRIFVGVYPNDIKTINVVKDISKQDPRIIACINAQDGPTTKADNLNCLYQGLCDYEKIYGEFEMIIVHDAEDFIHPGSLKLYNFLLGYKGYHGVQIPVLPIKSKQGKIFHRTYCDEFAEMHTKDLIVRQGMGTFMPFSGTGMGFHRKAMYYIEKANAQIRNKDGTMSDEEFKDLWGRKVELTNEYFKNDEGEKKTPVYSNTTNYIDDPFRSLDHSKSKYSRPTMSIIRDYSWTFIILVFSAIGFLVYSGYTSGKVVFSEGLEQIKDVNISGSSLNSGEIYGPLTEDKENVSPANFENKYNVIYVPLLNGKTGIQESVWGNMEYAKKRRNLILANPSFKDLEGFVVRGEGTDKNFFKVILGSFESISDLKKYTIEIRKHFPSK
jgi:hypothetical protein